VNLGRRLARAAVLAFTLAITACGGPTATEYPTQVVESVPSTIGEGDRIELRVFYGSNELKQEYTIGDDGTIAVPFIGDVTANGKSKDELETEVQAKLADGYLVNPVVSVDIKESVSKKLSVFGEVGKPGTLDVTVGMTIVDAISQAGGFTPLAKKNEVSVTRVEGNEKRRYTVPVEAIAENKAKMFMVQPGDVVFVPQRRW